jgi:hypothetical protein
MGMKYLLEQPPGLRYLKLHGFRADAMAELSLAIPTSKHAGLEFVFEVDGSLEIMEGISSVPALRRV